MHPCPQCPNRHFSTFRALILHARYSTIQHPYCMQCDRLFGDFAAHRAHNFSTSKHLPGPGPECNICHRLFRTVEGLEEHYRGSSAHPNCALCGAGSRDEPALSKHIMSYHGHPDDLVGKSTGSAFINQGVGEEMSGTIALSNRDLVVDGGSHISHASGGSDNLSMKPQVRNSGCTGSGNTLQESVYCQAEKRSHDGDGDFKLLHCMDSPDIQPATAHYFRQDCAMNEVRYPQPPTLPVHQCVRVVSPNLCPPSKRLLSSSNSTPIEFSGALCQQSEGMRATNIAYRSSWSLFKFHCRICGTSPSINPTATLCGHLYCYSCITKEVIAKGKCPFCQRLTGLYSLVEIDVLST